MSGILTTYWNNHPNSFVTYHGTSNKFADIILKSGPSVEIGGGELGRGFYSIDAEFRARRWASSKFGKTSSIVVKIQARENDVCENLTSLKLELEDAKALRSKIKEDGTTRTCLLGKDLILGNIVGGEQSLEKHYQYKWESEKAELFLQNEKYVSLHTI